MYICIVKNLSAKTRPAQFEAHSSKISNNNRNNSKIKSYIAATENNKSATTDWCVSSSSHCPDVKYTAVSSTAKLL